ncbi:MAG: hypothetical protein R3F60_02105 [bacterium]
MLRSGLFGRRLRIDDALVVTVRAAGGRIRRDFEQGGYPFAAWRGADMNGWPERFALVGEGGVPLLLWASDEPLLRDGGRTFYRPTQLEAAESVHGRGVGQAGLEAMAARAIEIGLNEIALFSLDRYDSPRAHPFYVRNGAVPHCFETLVADAIPLRLPSDRVRALAEQFERRCRDAE